jgi:hypothetical protein
VTLRQVCGFSPGGLVSSTNKTDRHDITEILLKVVLNTIHLNLFLKTGIKGAFTFVRIHCQFFPSNLLQIKDYHLHTTFSPQKITLSTQLSAFISYIIVCLHCQVSPSNSLHTFNCAPVSSTNFIN